MHHHPSESIPEPLLPYLLPFITLPFPRLLSLTLQYLSLREPPQVQFRRKLTILIDLNLGIDIVIELKSLQTQYQVRRQFLDRLQFFSLHLTVARLTMVLVPPVQDLSLDQSLK